MTARPPRGRAPPELRARIEDALARTTATAVAPRCSRPVPLGAVAACAAGALARVRDARPGRTALVEDAVRSHHRGLPLEVMAASVGEGSIPAWFAGKLDFNPAPPRFHAAGVHVLGARLSHLRELPAAYIRYELPRGQAGPVHRRRSGRALRRTRPRGAGRDRTRSGS